MTQTETRRSSRFGLIIGVTALAGGLWLLLNALDVGVPEFKRLWPGLLLLAGVATFIDYILVSRDPRSAGWSLAWLALGVLGFAVTLDFTSLAKMLDWLPSLPVIAGLGFLATWLADRANYSNNLIAAVILIALGLLGFAARFDWLRRILPSAQVIWALLFLIVGGYLVWRYALKAKK